MAGAAQGDIENAYGLTAGAMQTAAERLQQGMGYQGGTLAQAAESGLGAYMNPYQAQVLGQAEADINRQLQTQLGQIGAQATQAQAYGGSRQAVAEGMAREAAQRQQAQIAADLGYRGYTQALASAQQDIQNRLAQEQQQLSATGGLANLANIGFGQAQSIEDRLQGYGSQQQALQQALLNASLMQYGGFTVFPATALGYTSAALGAVPIPQTQTSSYSPGLFDDLTLGTAAASAFSDIRLKTNIQQVGQMPNGLPVYKWTWNDEAKRIGVGDQPTFGVMAHELLKVAPEMVMQGDDGYLRVNYKALMETI